MKTQLAALGTAAALAVGLAGCGGGDVTTPKADTATHQATHQTKVPKPSPKPEPTNVGPELSPRGNIIAKVGEDHGLTGVQGKKTVDFKVTKITTNAQCTSPYASGPAQNGQFIVLDATVHTTPALANQLFTTWSFIGDGTWSWIGADGVTDNYDPSSLNAMTCLAESQVLPAEIGPAETAKGSIVLDVATGPGTLVYTSAADPTLGWEWQVK